MAGVVTFGETMALGQAETTGPLAHVSALRLGIGGAESNVAIGARRLGVEATWIGRVGRDSLGAKVVRELRGEGLRLRVVEDPDAPTGFMVKERRTADSTRVWYYRAGSAGSRLGPEDVDEELVRGADVLHTTGITPGLSDSALAATRHAVDLAVDAGVPVSFDVNHRSAVWRGRDPGPLYREVAGRASVLFAGEDEARLVTGTAPGDREELLAALAALGPPQVVLKLGGEGCLALVDGRRLELPAVRISPVDTVGAGDAFVAGYLSELALGRPAEARLATAVRCGAFVCLVPGDWEGLPRRDELGVLDGGDPVAR